VPAGAADATRPLAAARGLFLGAVALAAFAAVVTLLALASAHGGAPNSDAATALLEGQAMAHGQLILHGWRLSSDSFWSVDDVLYLLASVVVGVRPVALYVVPAVIAALVAVVGIVMAADGRSRRAALAGGVVVTALVVFPSYDAEKFLLRGPLHVGTALLALVAFLLLRDVRVGWRWALAVVALVAGLLGDLMMVAYGVVPAVLAGAVAAGRRRSWRAGAATSGAGLTAAGLALAGRAALSAAGGFAIGKTGRLPHFHVMVHNLGRMFVLSSQLLGATWHGVGTGGVPVDLAFVRVVPAALVGLCTITAIGRLLLGVVTGRPSAATAGREHWRLDDLLAVAVIGALLTYVVLARNGSFQWSRYLTAAVIFGCVLTARTVAAGWERIPAGSAARGLGLAGLAMCGLLASGTIVTLLRPAPQPPVVSLVHWLEARHLDEGAGDYWLASIATVESGGRVAVRPVQPSPGDHFLERPEALTSAGWYGRNRFQFLAFQTNKVFGPRDLKAALRTWGAPSHVYVVGRDFEVATWPEPVELAASLVAGVTSPHYRPAG
jgi:hypothetical protein